MKIFTVPRKELYSLCILFLLALLLRLLFILSLPPHEFLQPLRDQKIYLLLAKQLAEGKGFICPPMEVVDLAQLPPTKTRRAIVQEAVQPNYFRGIVAYGQRTAFWLPGYPLFCGILTLIFGGEVLLGVRLGQSILGACLVFPMYLIAQHIYRDNRKWIGVVLTACYPFYIHYTGLAMTETLYTVLLATWIAVLIHQESRPTIGLTITCGLLAGATFLIRSVIAGLILLVPLAWCRSWHNPPKVVRHTLLFFGAVSVMIGPWLLRNYSVFDSLVLFPTKGGPTFWARNNPLFLAQELDATPFNGVNYHDLETNTLLHFPSFNRETEIERSALLLKRMLRFIHKNPFTYLKLCLLKCRWLLSPFGGPETPWWQQLVSLCTYGVTFLFAILGLVWDKDIRSRGLSCSAMLCYFVVLHSLINGDTRFRIPLDIFFILLAIPIYDRTLKWIRRHIFRRMDSPSR